MNRLYFTAEARRSGSGREEFNMCQLFKARGSQLRQERQPDLEIKANFPLTKR